MLAVAPELKRACTRAASVRGEKLGDWVERHLSGALAAEGVWYPKPKAGDRITINLAGLPVECEVEKRTAQGVVVIVPDEALEASGNRRRRIKRSDLWTEKDAAWRAEQDAGFAAQSEAIRRKNRPA